MSYPFFGLFGALGQMVQPGKARRQRIIDRVHALYTLPDLSFPANTVADGLVADEIAAHNLDRRLRAIFPTYADAGLAKPDQPLAPTELLVIASYAMTGLEQVLLQLSTAPDEALQLTLYWYADLVPEAAKQVVQNLIEYLQSGHAVQDLSQGLHHVLTNIWENPDLFQAAGTVAIGIAEKHVPWNEVTDMAGRASFDAAKSLVEGFSQHAVDHAEIMDIGGTLGDLVDKGHTISIADAAHAHFPIITLARSLSKQATLVLDGATTGGTASLVVGIDTASVMIGATLGQILIPIPIVGGIVGAWAGRVLGNQIKKETLHNGKLLQLENELQRLQDEVPQQLRAAAEDGARQLSPAWDSARHRYIGYLPQPPRFASTAGGLIQQMLRLQTHVARQLNEDAQMIDEGYRLYRKEAARRRNNLPPYFRYELDGAAARVKQWRAALPEAAAIRGQPAEVFTDLLAIAQAAVPQYQADISTLAAALPTSAHIYHHAVHTWLQEAQSAYNAAIEQLAPSLQKVLNDYGERRLAIQQAIETKAEAVKHERQLLGLRG